MAQMIEFYHLCSAISLALVNSRTVSSIVVLSLQTLPLRPDTERDWYARMEWGWLARLYFTVLLLGNNIRSTTCDGACIVVNMWAQGNNFNSYACNQHDESHHYSLCFYALHTSMRAITVI